MTNRRNFLKTAGIGLAAATIPGVASASVSEAKSEKGKFKFQLGVASYSLRNFSQEEALNMTARCGIDRICFKSMHLQLEADTETIKKAVALCNEKGITLYGGGVIYMKDKAQVDQAFEYAKAAGMEMIVGVPNHELLEYVSGKVKE